MKVKNIIILVLSIFIIIFVFNLSGKIFTTKPTFIKKWEYISDKKIRDLFQNEDSLFAFYRQKEADPTVMKYCLLSIDKKTGSIEKTLYPINLKTSDSAFMVEQSFLKNNELFLIFHFDASKMETLVNKFEKFDIKESLQKWSKDINVELGLPPGIDNNKIIFIKETLGQIDKHLRLTCLASNTGDVIWENSSLIGKSSTPLILDNKLFIASESQKEDRNAGNDCFMSCFDLNTGKLIWQIKLPDEAYWLRGKPLYFKGKVYITTLGNFYGLDPETGKINFKLQNRIFVLNPFSQYFYKLGIQEIRFGSEGNPAFDEKRNLVYFSNYPSFAFDLRTGQLKKIYPQYWYSSGRKISKAFLISTVVNEANRKKYFKDAYRLQWQGELIVLDKYLISYLGIFDKDSGRLLEKLPCGGAKDMSYDYKTNMLYVLNDKGIFAYEVKLK